MYGLHFSDPFQDNCSNFVQRILRAILDRVLGGMPEAIPSGWIIKIDDVTSRYSSNVIQRQVVVSDIMPCLRLEFCDP